MRFATAQGFNTGDDFFAYLRDSYDALRAEDLPKMMSVGLHCRLAGRPGRAAAVAKFLDHLEMRGDAWICRRADIARYWRKTIPSAPRRPRNAMTWRVLPPLLFLCLAGLLAVGLNLNPREVPSPLVGKAAPDFSLPQLHNPEAEARPADMRGQVWLLNVWASWCVSCRAEHHVLVRLAENHGAKIVGLNYKDEAEDAKRWLRERGDPYVFFGA